MLKRLIFLAFLAISCGPQQGPYGIAQSPICSEDCGPAVVFQPTRTDDIWIPFPNDMLCRFDPEAATGCRLNLGTKKSTRSESLMMQHLNEMDGFSTYAPIIVSFDGPLDLSTVDQDSILLVNIDPKSPGFGEKVPLDLGRGDFPTIMESPYPLFPGDPYARDMSLLFPDDNTADLDNDGLPDRVEFYHKASNTLLIRPRLPLQEGTRYAVVITRKVKGFSPSGKESPVRSPLPWVNVPSQTRFLAQGLPQIEKHGVAPGDIAFAWTFVTSTIQDQIMTIRKGLYGKGPFAWMQDMVKDGFVDFHNTGIPFDGDGSQKKFPYDPHDNIYILKGSFVSNLISIIGAFLPQAKNYKFNYVDYFVFGDLRSINLRTTPDHVWQIDPKHGGAWAVPYKIPFMITVPKPTKHHKPPFKVVLYAHGNQTSRFELLLMSNYLARQGLAAIVVDEIGHGPLVQGVSGILRELRYSAPDISEDVVLNALAALVLPDEKDWSELSKEEKVNKLQAVGLIQEFTKYGRAVDLNQDGRIENGEGFFVPNPMEQRDIFRQMMVDYMVIARLIRSLDPKKVPPAYKGDQHKARYADLLPHLKAGDFNADGVLDIGGPDQGFYMSGVSLGGIMTTLVTSYEPTVDAAAPFVAGGGLADVLMRSQLRNRLKAGLYFAIGPVLSTCKGGNGKLYLFFNDAVKYSTDSSGNAKCKGDLSGAVYAVEDVGYQSMSALNLSNNRQKVSLFNDQGVAWIALPSDKGDQWRVTLNTKAGKTVSFLVQTPVAGLASRRDSHKFISNFVLTQTILDPADPINAISRVLRHPARPEGPKNFLQMAVIADYTVPVGTQVGMARAGGFFGVDQGNWEYWDDQFIDHGIIKGEDHNVDDMEGLGNGFGPVPVIRTKNGECAVRFANVHGYHEYMAEPNPDGPGFDWATFALNQVSLFLGSGGKKVVDDVCIERNDCPLLDQYR